nr:FMN-binding protein [Brooklawnia cerclae]
MTDGTWTGSPASERYGTWTVTITVQGGRITDVTGSANSSESRSDQINSRAEPILTSEVLSAQSADVDAVSGATYSSRAYLSSLQSALDQASA